MFLPLLLCKTLLLTLKHAIQIPVIILIYYYYLQMFVGMATKEELSKPWKHLQSSSHVGQFIVNISREETHRLTRSDTKINLTHYKTTVTITLLSTLPSFLRHCSTKELNPLEAVSLTSIQHSGIGPGSVRGPWPLPSAELRSWPVGHLSEGQVRLWTVCRGGTPAGALICCCQGLGVMKVPVLNYSGVQKTNK